jgi:hypothetical protein|nr:MAG TPA: hypothetical protein [Caudoviricetes sp.]
MELVTGRSGKPHITSQQVRQLQQGIFGANACILNTGSMLAPEVQSSNKIRIKDGALMFQGALFTVKVGVYDEVTINNGNQGMKRKDVIAVKYTYDSSRNIESGEWAVVQGTPAASNPAVPSMPVTDGDIQAGDAEVYCPVFVINLDGINVTGVDIIPPMMDDMSTINKYLSELQDRHKITKLTAKDLALNGAWSTMFFNCVRRDNTVRLNVELFSKTIVANRTYNNVFTVPATLRPSTRYVINAYATDASYGNAVACMAMIDTKGNIMLTIPKSTNNYVFIDAEWEVG